MTPGRISVVSDIGVANLRAEHFVRRVLRVAFGRTNEGAAVRKSVSGVLGAS